jgi:hypothetical protein
MTSVAFELYFKAECPHCGALCDIAEISVDEKLQPTFFYRCFHDHEFHRFRPRSLDTGELEKVILFTKRQQ